MNVTLNDGRQVLTAYSRGPAGVNPFGHMILSAPMTFRSDVSIYKFFSLTERLRLRVNVDAFNAFNNQGKVNFNTSDGIQSLQTSYWTPSQTQFSARFDLLNPKKSRLI